MAVGRSGRSSGWYKSSRAAIRWRARWNSVAQFLTVADIERSARFYETVFGGRIVRSGDGSGLPGYIQIANAWLVVNVGGGPTPDKPSVTLSVPPTLVQSAVL
jgi:predicted enzyme related to lactoylglutathione lyase